ncbi:hypothetical protein B0T18DRAFT_387259 [Schizothecium vesticola]|uniref:Uncharacterized protein n=1 Tax=Schizothecium vesticola TaxID=314040 RepID=A0AA40F4H9_9PEZI|nr:hypothetical protein B0T18DRAFT_387259 [Schizothecium vesticola]
MLKAVKRARSQQTMGVGPVVGLAQLAAVGAEGRGPGTRTPLDQGPDSEYGSVSATALHPRAASRQGSSSRHGNQNGHIPPVVFPDGRNPYLERPLPPPPPKSTSTTPRTAKPPALALRTASPPAPVMASRPSTSSGPSGRAAASNFNFEKRLSKDDMSVNGHMGMSVGRTKVMPSWRPGARPGALPTPDASPEQMLSPPLPHYVPARMPTPESVSSGEIQIGMALGSPTTTTTSPVASWQPRPLTPPRDVYSPLPPQRTPEPAVQRQKTQKRKFFGSLFGSRKHADKEKEKEKEREKEREKDRFLEPAADAQFITTITAPSMTSLDRSGEITPLRSNTVAGRKTPRFMASLSRSRTEPEMDNVVQQAAKQPVPEVRVSDTDRRPVHLNSTNAWSAEDTGPSSPPRGPGLLDIEIPDVRLERYSIMFSGVLNPGGSEAQTSSLLARRQATLEKLKTINDRVVNEVMAGEKGLVRRATSPHYAARSPAFSLFPPPQGHQQRVSPRMRSNTLPDASSPSQEHFEVPEIRTRKEAKRVTILSPRAMDERNRQAAVERLRERQIQMAKVQREQQAQQVRQPPQAEQVLPAPQALPSDFVFKQEESVLILDSPQSSMSGLEEVASPTEMNPPLKPRINEPQWEIISPPSTSALSEAGSMTTKRTASSASSNASSVKTHITRPSLEMEDDDAALRAAVEISIARQISISRQQRNLLRTTTKASSIPRSVSIKKNPMPTTGLPGRMLDSKQSVPTVVDMHLGQNRKSARVVLEAM